MTAVLVPVIAVWAYAAIELHLLALRRGRRAVRSAAQRARAALIIGTLFAGAAAAAAMLAAEHGWRAPLLLLPAAAAARLTLPRLGRLIRRLYADPWGPSDPPVRHAAAHPAVVVPAQSALLGALVAGYAATWAAAIVSYGFVAAATVGMVLDARRRRARRQRLRTGALPRVLVRRGCAQDRDAGRPAEGQATEDRPADDQTAADRAAAQRAARQTVAA